MEKDSFWEADKTWLRCAFDTIGTFEKKANLCRLRLHSLPDVPSNMTRIFNSARNTPKLIAGTLALSLLATTGCQVAPSKTATGAGTGALAGGVIGGVASPGGNSGQGMLAGAAAGAVIGGVIGAVQEAKERREQDRLAQERAYQQDLARKRAEDAKAKAEFDEELAVAQGFKISDLELNEAQRKVDDATSRLNKLKDERNAALQKKKALDEANERLLNTEAEIARMEEELARLKGETPTGTGAVSNSDSNSSSHSNPPSTSTPPGDPASETNTSTPQAPKQ